MMKRFGLIGKTLRHSFSENYFSKKFNDEGIVDCSYQNFELAAIDQLHQLLKNNPDLLGLNVTIPYKEKVLSFLDVNNELVQKIGACNCIKIVDGNLFGYNTDAIAFKKSLQSKLQPHHQSALILGSGGASKAIQFVLKEMDIDFLIVSRSKTEEQLSYEAMGEKLMSEYQIIINTTPLGMFPNVDEAPPIPYQFISTKHLLFDLIYNPAKTKFLSQGEKQGAQIINGYEMLVEQAEESWRIWREVD